MSWTVADKIPDAPTLLGFREAPVRAGLFEQLYEAFTQQRQAGHAEFPFAKPRAAG